MNLQWHNGVKDIIVKFSNGDIHECSGSVWSRVGDALAEDVFVAINLYWSKIPNEQVLLFENKYREIIACFAVATDPHILNVKLKPLVCQLLDLFDWAYFKLWCNLHANLFLDNGIKDTLDDKDKEGLTYYTEDYNDLMVFSIMLKAVMPVWGMYHKEFTESIGKYYIHIAAVELIRSPAINKLAPMLKLESYIECFTKIKVKKTGYSLLSGIGSEEIPTFLMSLALIKKVVIYNVQDPNSSIVKNVYHLLNERCNEITKFKPNEKKDTDTEGGDLAIADRYKIVQRLSPGASEMVRYYGNDILKMAMAIDPTVPRSLVLEYASKVGNSLNFTENHIPILALIGGNVISGRTLRVVPYETVMNMTKACAAVAEHWGYLEVAELLTVQPIKKDIMVISSSAAGNRSFSQLRPDIASAMSQIYVYLSNNKNPGITLIDAVIKDIIKFEWPVKSENFNDIRNSLALLFIKQFKGVPECQVK